MIIAPVINYAEDAVGSKLKDSQTSNNFDRESCAKQLTLEISKGALLIEIRTRYLTSYRISTKSYKLSNLYVYS